ncbi:hypothetical protein [Actinomadura sp. WMMB 499]|uniref:hypothetical protein n=1 Tax=Actinomadura sp. WMMB 499 TaxID=1219491 RepID=UPI0012445D61|nr:hypothetical protein [Actinomadura sp. WMMB 499]QFG21178.1 hypothetical protein F7P10_08510 [Actinomadura sp. WMMB 499]
MTMRRMVMTAGGAVLPVAVIALIFGNQWTVEAITGEGRDGGLWPLLFWLQHPQWSVYPDDFYNWGYVISLDFGLILFFVLLAGLAAAGVRAVDPNRGMLGAVVTGWWACVVAAGVSSLVTGLLVKLTLDMEIIGGPVGGSIVWNTVAGGAAFGLVYGWIAGLGALAGFHFGRDRGFGGQQQPMQQAGMQQAGMQQGYVPQGYVQQPYAQQPGAPMQPQMPPPGQQPVPGQPMAGQQPYAQPQHPSAVPYVPPQGGPQQPAWGAAPQQPAVPPQASAPEPPAPAPPAAQQPPAPDAPTLEPPAQEPPTQADDETVPAGSEDGPGSGGDLADTTMLDHEPDAGREPDARDDRPMPPPA